VVLGSPFRAMDMASGTPSTSAERVEVAHELLTIKEAAAAMRVSLSLGYQLAHEYLNSGGTAGLPVLRFGTCMRVPRWALVVLITTGRVVRLADAAAPTDELPLRSLGIANSRSPAFVVNVRGRCPLRSVTRSSLRS